MEASISFDEFGYVEMNGLKWISPIVHVPPRQHPILYRTAHYQSAGYVNADGHWHSAGSTPERHPVLCWTSLG